MRDRKWLKWLIRVGGLVLAIIGLAGLPEDLRTWRGWLGSVGGFLVDAVDGQVVRSVIFGVGMAILLVPPAVKRIRDSRQWPFRRVPKSPFADFPNINPGAPGITLPLFSVRAMPSEAMGVWSQSVVAGYSCRLAVHTDALGGTFFARVLAVDGMTTEHVPPWPVRWRDFAGLNAVIMEREHALLELATINKASIGFHAAGGQDWRATIMPIDRNGGAVLVRTTFVEASENVDRWFGIRFDDAWVPSLIPLGDI